MGMAKATGCTLLTLWLAACGPAGDAADAAIGMDGPSPHDIVSIRINPSAALLTSTDGSRPTQAFTVEGLHPDGTGEFLDGIWSIASTDLGTLDLNSAIFTASGTAGGVVQVHVSVPRPSGTLTADAPVTVVLKQTVVVGTTPGDAGSHFTTPPVTDAARAVVLDYPLEGALMPQNVYPADVQWENGVAQDIYRITLHKPNMDGVAYLVHPGAAFTYDWVVGTAMWRAFAQSDGDAAGTITVDRWDHTRGDVVAGTPVSVRFARAALAGTVYYWDIAAGRVVRIDDGSGTGVQFMPNPPADTTGGHCVGCHSVSNDGRWFIGRLGPGDNIGGIFDLTTDLTGNPPPTVYPLSNASIKWWFASFNPDASRMIAEENQVLTLIDPHTGLAVPLGGGSQALPASASTHPAWSPDGSLIAYVSGINDWGGNFTSGNISVIPVTGGDTFGSSVVMHVASTLTSPDPAAGNADSYPSFSPDSKWLAFAHGSGCRSDDKQAALYLMKRDSSGLVRLDRASGGTSVNSSYHPTFAPFNSGGYYWITFLSRRDYGNTQAGTKGTTRQQLWVAAISNNPTAGQDPSQVGYWLPGQATSSKNISAFWAPRACRQNGAVCGVSAECCSDLCAPSTTPGQNTCQSPPASMCRMIGQSCGGASDCCMGLTCAANVCDLRIQ